MSFGLTGAPNTFQGAMSSTLCSLLCKCVLVFFDDILIYSPTLESHLEHIRQVFTLLAADQWKVKFNKCRFVRQSISYLGILLVTMAWPRILKKSSQFNIGHNPKTSRNFVASWALRGITTNLFKTLLYGLILSLTCLRKVLSVFRNCRLVNLVDCAFRFEWLCKEDMRMYTGSGGMSLRPVASCCLCYLHWVRSRGYKRLREGRAPKPLWVEVKSVFFWFVGLWSVCGIVIPQ
jgi:hypothetical protein